MFPEVVARTATPSVLFLPEGEDVLRDRRVKDDDRVNFSEGALRLALRHDVPFDLRNDTARSIAEFLWPFNDPAKCDARCGEIAVRFLDAFHGAVAAPQRDLDYAGFLFNSLLGQWLAPRVVQGAPRLRDRLPAFAKDAAAYSRQLENAGRKPEADTVRKRTSQEIDYFSKHPAGKN